MNEENNIEFVIPRLNPEGFEVDENIRQMGKSIGPIPAERIKQDPRLRAILGEGVSED